MKIRRSYALCLTAVIPQLLFCQPCVYASSQEEYWQGEGSPVKKLKDKTNQVKRTNLMISTSYSASGTEGDDTPGSPGKRRKHTHSGEYAASILMNLSSQHPLILQGCASSSTDEMEQKIKSLKEKLEIVFSTTKRTDLYPIYKDFRNMNYPEQEWENLGIKTQTRKWPSQISWKEAVGGELFFPASLISIYQQSSYTEVFIERTDMLAACMIAAAFRHSLAYFYLSHIIRNKNWPDENDGRADTTMPSYQDTLLERACMDLQQCLDHDDVCYALGKAARLYRLPHINLASEELHKKSKTPENRCALLELKAINASYSKSEEILEGFLSLALNGYFPAFQEAAAYAKKIHRDETEENILQNAVDNNYRPAIVSLALWHRDKNDFEQYELYLEKARNLDLTQAFLITAIDLIGDVDMLPKEEGEYSLAKVSVENIEKACTYLEKAVKLYDFRACEYLGAIYLQRLRLADTEESRKEFLKNAKKYIIEGSRLGSKICFSQLSYLSTHHGVKLQNDPIISIHMNRTIEKFLEFYTEKELPGRTQTLILPGNIIPHNVKDPAATQ